ncbi:MAG: hypothetical protein HUU35_19980 [Armatimonadetes bacterium]|nr:hypothetical protein [Armatimonadota bacterium]
MSRAAGWTVAAVFAAAMLQTTWLPRLQVAGEWADPVLVLVLVTALLHGTEAGLVAGFAAGLLMGWLTSAAGAAFLISRLVGAVGIGFLAAHWHRENVLVQMVAVVVGTIGCELVFAGLYPPLFETPDLAFRLCLRGLLNALLAAPAMWLVDRLPWHLEVARP